MRTSHFILPNKVKDQYVYRWLPDEQRPRAVIHIFHGMAEHAGRYEYLAKALTDRGYVVYASDLAGHGKTCKNIEDTGFFYNSDGWFKVVDDLKKLTGNIKWEYSGVPHILLGHSMGSFIARTYASIYPKDIHGLILSGTTWNPGMLLKAGRAIAGIQSFFAGNNFRSNLLDKMSFGSFNARISPVRTKFDWLTHDEAIVDAYIADDRCGFVCTAKMFANLFTGLKFIQKTKNILEIPVDLPVYIFSGSMDPVGHYSKGPAKVAQIFEECEMKDVTLKLYEGGRHEMLNEINRDEVIGDLLNWLEQHVSNTK
ncbi:MAG: lysophospholipase [Bacteroidota bacterium]